jgi:hypothetical protein
MILLSRRRRSLGPGHRHSVDGWAAATVPFGGCLGQPSRSPSSTRAARGTSISTRSKVAVSGPPLVIASEIKLYRLTCLAYPHPTAHPRGNGREAIAFGCRRILHECSEKPHQLDAPGLCLDSGTRRLQFFGTSRTRLLFASHNIFDLRGAQCRLLWQVVQSLLTKPTA